MPKAARMYPADDVSKPLRKPNTLKPTKLRASIAPGQVLILLAGRFKGKRVVFLKQLESGLLLVTGPFKVNGVPLRRVNQRYVIATSTKVDVAGADVAAVGDAYFKREAAAKGKKGEDEFFAEGGEVRHEPHAPARPPSPARPRARARARGRRASVRGSEERARAPACIPFARASMPRRTTPEHGAE